MFGSPSLSARTILLLGLSLIFSACSKNSSEPVASPSSTTFTVSGRAALGPISGGTVSVYSLSAAGARGDLITSTSTDASGNYSVTIPPDTGAVIIVITGGSYVEEATGSTVSVGAQEITAVVESVDSNLSISVTPLTHIAATRALEQVVDGAVLSSAISSANSAVALAAGLPAGTDITTITPPNPSATLASQGVAVGSVEAKYALFLAALSQYGQDHGGVSSMAVMEAFASDLQNDGVFDGDDAGAAITVTGGSPLSTSSWSADLYQAQTDFVAGAANSGGLTLDSATLPIAQAPTVAEPPAGASVSGTVVTTFGTNGIVTAGQSPYYRTFTTLGVLAAQSDGKVVGCGLVGEDYTQVDWPYLIRFNANGSLDTTFGDNGYQVLTSATYADPDFPALQCTDVKIQSDGKILVTVSDAIGSGSQLISGTPQIFRLTTAGVLDSTFGTNGRAAFEIDGYLAAQVLTVQTDGKILVAGINNNGLAVIRINANGASLDTGFGNADHIGLYPTSITLPDATALHVQSDGKILVGGARGVYALAMRLTAAGALDTSFGPINTGTINTGDSYLGDLRNVKGFGIQSDGKLIVAGTTTAGAAMIRFNANATLVDTTFGTSGTASLTITSGAYYTQTAKFYLQGDDKPVLVGSRGLAGDATITIAKRFTAAGAADNTYDASSATDSLDDEGIGYSLAVDPNGGFYTAAENSFALARITATGTRDASVNAAGVSASALSMAFAGEGFDSASATAIQPDGKIVVAGVATGTANLSILALSRYNTDGSLDTSFGTGGYADLNTDLLGGTVYVKGIALQSDGKILITGAFGGAAANKFAMVRFTAAGALDTTFGTAGLATVAVETGASSLTILSLPNGKILIGGNSSSANSDYSMSVARFTNAGVIDTTFATNGILTLPVGSNSSGTYSSSVASMALQPNGMILLGGDGLSSIDQPALALVRITASGALDATFGTGGKVVTEFTSENGAAISKVFVQGDGKIAVVAGTNGGNVALARYSATGTLDATFGTAGIQTFGAGNATLESAAIDSSGRFVIAAITASESKLRRFTTEGALDTTFGTSGVAEAYYDNTVVAMAGLAIAPDGTLVIVGTATPGLNGSSSSLYLTEVWP